MRHLMPKAFDLVLWFKTELDSVEELVPRGRGKDGTCPRAGEVEGAVKVHDPEA
jgi:hypothetical protein